MRSREPEPFFKRSREPEPFFAIFAGSPITGSEGSVGARATVKVHSAAQLFQLHIELIFLLLPLIFLLFEKETKGLLWGAPATTMIPQPYCLH